MTYSANDGARVQRALNDIRSMGLARTLQVQQRNGVTYIHFEGEQIASYVGRKDKAKVMAELLVLQEAHHKAVLELVSAKLIANIKVPDGHVFSADSANMLGGISSDQSCRVTFPHDGNGYPDCLSTEFRIHMDAPRASLFMTYGPQCNFQSISLLVGKQSFQYASSYEELAANLATVFNSQLALIPEAQSTLEQRRQLKLAS